MDEIFNEIMDEIIDLKVEGKTPTMVILSCTLYQQLKGRLGSRMIGGLPFSVMEKVQGNRRFMVESKGGQ